MDNQVTNGPDAVASVPEIVITKPSPLVQNTAVSLAEKAVPTPEDIPKQNPQITESSAAVVIEPAQIAAAQATSALETEANSSGEFTSALECNDCVVPVAEQSESRSAEATTATSEPDQDDFRTVSATGCFPCGIGCLEYYERLWNIMHSAYAIPFWFLLLALPLSAGVMGALYMFSCPAAHAIATLTFIIGISLMAVISLRVCIIVHGLTTDDETSRHLLHTLQLIATFLTVVFFITESVAFWRMDSASHPGTSNYCDPHFVTYAFWWNCVMSVVLVPIFLFPA